MKSNFDCIVIGAGIAGMTAAIYLKRANINVLLLDKNAPGGVLNKVKTIENYPGFTRISGPDLAYNVYQQIMQMGIEVQYGNVLSIDNHVVKTDIGDYTTKFVIIATGRQAKKISEQNIENLSYCVLCDANLYKDKNVAIITDDNKDEVLYLADICQSVILISTKLKLNKDNIINIDKIRSLDVNNKIVKKIITDSGEYPIDGIFVSLGYEPKIEFLNEINKDNNYIIVDSNMKTNIDYIYACGDIIKKNVYQISTAIGEAAQAAISIKNKLKGSI